ncbi:heme o synthase [Haloferax sp. YSSS75]|uniref:heme o synthase n=1 Tax=Haloferax sp. YSSS75 TaxID=3388564 RepID=UPI00398D2E3D
MAMVGTLSRRVASLGVVELLTATTIGVYLLVVVGVSTAFLDGATACSTWPLCSDELLLSLDDPLPYAVAWGHRVVALVVGLLLFGTAVRAWASRQTTPTRVRTALTVGAALYPVQVAIGALTAVSGAPTSISSVHLVVAMTIFSALLLALLWQLEVETPVEESAAASRPVADQHPHHGSAVSTATPTDDTLSLDAQADAIDTQASLGFADLVRAYVSLTKPKLWWLLCLVALASMGIAGGRTLDPWTVVATLVGGVLAIGASGTFNNVLERDVDRRMARTNDRPLVEGRIPVRNAVNFGFVLTFASVVVFVTFVNVLAAALGALAIVFYTVVYTLLLKPHTTHNIVLGGAVGAFPALIGWAAVTNTVGMPAIVLGVVIFLWTPAHFYNLAMAYRDDYERAGFPMLPVVRGESVTRRHIMLYLGATMLAAIALGSHQRLDVVYAVTVAAVGGVFVWAVVGLFRERTERAAFRAFHTSNAYLGSLLVAVVVDTLLL